MTSVATKQSAKHVAALEAAPSIAEEIKVLEAIRVSLVHTEFKSSLDLEEEWLSLASNNLGDEVLENPFPHSTPEGLFPQADDLNRFTCYVFRRRYGWSEAATSSGAANENIGANLAAGRDGPPCENQVALKNKLNEMLDEFVKWFLSQQVSKLLLQSLRYTIAQASDKPVVRNQTVVHAMDWIKLHKSHASIHTNYSDIEILVVAGLTDIWSAIRKACVSRLSGVIASFTIQEAEDFFTTLAKICQRKDSSWQSVEGALMAINSLMRKFQWISRQPVEPFSRGFVDDKRYFVKFGNEELPNIPAFITTQMHSIAYPLLAHPQLSVRECAIKVFTSFLSRCEFQEALSSFSEAISRLDQGATHAPPAAHPDSPEQWRTPPDAAKLPHHAVLRKDFTFLNAYEAEGLLGVCLYLIKHIPPGFLLPKWPFYFSVFSLYLMHPASTVRQITSELFRYLIAKDCNNVALLKLVLQGLSANWGISIKYMSQPAHTFSHFHTLSHDNSHPTAATKLETAGTSAASGKPGCTTAGATIETTGARVPAVALEGTTPPQLGVGTTGGARREGVDGTLDGVLDPSGILGETTLHSPRQSRRRQQPFYGQGKAVSIVNISQLEGDTTAAADSVLCRAWEWREGRLFAYELIIKFLIVNHIHYLFPSYAMPPLKFNGSASTDESIIPSHKANKVTQGKPPIQKSLSHGGVSLRQGWLKRTPSEHSDEGSCPSPDAVVSKPPTPPPSTSPSTPPPLKEDPSDEIFTRAGSERRKRTLDQKRAQTMAEGSFFNQPMAKHYSFPGTADGTSGLPGARRASHGLSGTLSLLGLTHDADKHLTTQMRKPLEDAKAALLDPIQPVDGRESSENDNIRGLSTEARHLLDAYRSLVKADARASHTSIQLPWLQGLQLESLTNILNQILLQTVNSLASSRWELRRMSQQALPLVAECLRWYHPESLVGFWNRCLTSDASLLCYGAALTLKHSIQHAHRMMQFLQQPVSGWRRDSESCRQVSASIVVAVTQGLSEYVLIARQLMQREVVDKLSVVAMEILLIALAHFEEELEQERDVLDNALHQFQIRIFSHAHPESVVCSRQPKFSNAHDVLVPLDGFLCCCLRDDNTVQYGRQLERYVLRETHGLTLDYLRRCSPAVASRTLPLLLTQLRGYQEDEDIAKTLLDGCCLLVTMVKGHITENGKAEAPQDFNKNLELSLLEISSLVKLRTLDLSMLRQMLEMYQDLSLCVQSSSHLQTLFTAVASRLDMLALNPIQAGEEGAVDGEGGMAGRLVLFASNDIPASPVDNLRISDDEEDEDEDRKGSSHPLSESLALNASSGSGQTPRHSSGSDPTVRLPGVSPSAGTDAEDSDSDWDSWDDDEEDQSVFQEAVADFLRQLQGYLGTETFHAELSRSSDRERTFIRRILSS